MFTVTLIEGGEAGALQGRDMNDHVLSAPLRLDEPVAFGGVEPLYVSYRVSEIPNLALRRLHSFGEPHKAEPDQNTFVRRT